MVVDDSTYMRYVITQILESSPDIEVVEKSRNGVEALAHLPQARPDVITLDVQMPEMDGLHFLEEMRKTYRIPTIMLSSLTVEGGEDTMRALELGAIDFVPKPTGIASLTLDDVGEDLIRKVMIASEIKPEFLAPVAEHVERAVEAPTAEGAPAKAAPRVLKKVPVLKRVVAVACSTGGPRALAEVLPQLPADLDACVIVVQHMPAGFTKSLADRLGTISPIKVVEASDGDRIEPGTVYIAPGDYHLRIGKGDRIALDQDPPRHGVRPCADVMMESVAKAYGSQAVGVVLTGMGVDGTLGSKAIKAGGGYIIAEHESTCVVYGMPKSVVSLGIADRVLRLQLVANGIVEVSS